MVFWSPLWPRLWARRLAAVGGMTLLGGCAGLIFSYLTVVMAVVCGVFSDDAEDVGVLINFLLMV